MSEIPRETFRDRVDWPEPRPEPEAEPAAAAHEAPLDNPEDGRWLSWDDPRRVQAERDRGRPFDDDDEVGYEGER